MELKKKYKVTASSAGKKITAEITGCLSDKRDLFIKLMRVHKIKKTHIWRLVEIIKRSGKI